MAEERNDTADLAVLAHGLLNPMHVIIGALSTVRRDLGPDHDDASLLSVAHRQAEHVAESLRQLVRGLPVPDVVGLDLRAQEHHEVG